MFRKKIIEAHKEGYSVSKIAQRLMISPTGEVVFGNGKKNYPDWTLREYCECSCFPENSV